MPRDPTQLMAFKWPMALYNELRKWFPLFNLFSFFCAFIIDAPFGRFAPSASDPSTHSIFPLFNMQALQVDGIRSWIFMELISPFTFIYAFLISPLTFYTPDMPSLTSPITLACTLFMIHYANRALISPLRTPSRSKSHLVVVLLAAGFNLANGYLLGSYFSSPMARIYIGGSYAYMRPSFWIGMTLWLVGFIGNIAHDEILLDIRRKAKARKEKDGEEREDAKKKGKEPKKPAEKGEYYGIPQGLLYDYISFPNYFCEWIEWFGFALATSPPPVELSFASPADFIQSLLHNAIIPLCSPKAWSKMIKGNAYGFAPLLTPPWIFFFGEILVMLPRAYRGHKWYKKRFGESYPKNRKAVIPFVL